MSGIPKFWRVIGSIALLHMSAASSAEPMPSTSVLNGAASRCKQLTIEDDIVGLIIQSTRHVTQKIKQADPSYCEVIAKDVSEKGSSIGMIFRLPDRWNGKILGLGGGGFAGNLTLQSALPGLKRGYATFQNDTGHNSAMPWDTSWAKSDDGTANAIGLIDFGFRAVHIMTQSGKAVVKAYYAKQASRAYFQGCSQGGRQGLVEAQRYPQDYDGIISGAPAFTDHSRVSMAMIGRAFRAPGAALSEQKIKLVNQGALRACDATDGLKDGIITDPSRCKWDPRELLCRAEMENNSCLTQPQVEAVRSVYSDKKGPLGETLAYGLPRGSELATFPWYMALKQDTQVFTGYANFAAAAGIPENTDFSRNDVLADHYLQKNSLFGVTYLADNPDLAPYFGRGGKLLLWQGMYDLLIPPRPLVDYFEKMLRVTKTELAATGSRTDIDDSARLFLAPGVSHCMGGPGHSDFDALAVIEDWVEQGNPPSRIEADQPQPRMVEMAEALLKEIPAEIRPRGSRPLCAWPRLPRYQGNGDSNDARSFKCVE